MRRPTHEKSAALALVTLILIAGDAFGSHSVPCSYISSPPGAVYLSSDTPNATFFGINFGINGNDVNFTNGLPGPLPPIWGIATRTEEGRLEIINSLNSQQRNNIQGLGYVPGSPPTPSVSAVNGPTTAQINQLIADLVAQPHVTNSSSHINGSWTFGTAAVPTITYLNSGTGVTFGNGNATGYGVMIVENSLTLNGNLDFNGLVIVRGPIYVTEVTGSAQVWGSIWTSGFELTVGGHADIQYSSQALAAAQTAGASLACEMPSPTETAPTQTPTAGPTATVTPVPSETSTPSPAATTSETPTIAPTSTVNATPNETATNTHTPTATMTPTETQTPSATASEMATGAPTPTPLPTLGCGTVPDAGCRRPTGSLRSALLMKDRLPDKGDFLRWKWSKGQATLKVDFGDPTTSTGYVLCIYDHDGSAPSHALTAKIPAGRICGARPCWKDIARGFKYFDKAASQDGIVSLTLKEGLEGAAAIGIKGNGESLGMPTLPLAQESAVVVQLKNDAGFCWEAVYSGPATKNTQIEFRDKSD